MDSKLGLLLRDGTGLRLSPSPTPSGVKLTKLVGGTRGLPSRKSAVDVLANISTPFSNDERLGDLGGAARDGERRGASLRVGLSMGEGGCRSV